MQAPRVVGCRFAAGQWFDGKVAASPVPRVAPGRWRPARSRILRHFARVSRPSRPLHLSREPKKPREVSNAYRRGVSGSPTANPNPAPRSRRRRSSPFTNRDLDPTANLRQHLANRGRADLDIAESPGRPADWRSRRQDTVEQTEPCGEREEDHRDQTGVEQHPAVPEVRDVNERVRVPVGDRCRAPMCSQTRAGAIPRFVATTRQSTRGRGPNSSHPRSAMIGDTTCNTMSATESSPSRSWIGRRAT